MRVTQALDRFPRTKHAVHASVDRAIRVLARAGLDLNRRRIRIGDPTPQSARIRFTKIADPQFLPMRGPASRHDPAPAGFSRLCAQIAQGYSRPAEGVLEIAGGRFHLPSGIVAVGGRLPSELIPLTAFPHSFQFVPALRALGSRATPIPDGALINLQMSMSYYHWACEILPRALIVAEQTPVGEPLYVAAGMPSYVHELLSLVGLEDRCVALEPGVYRAQRLLVPAFELAEWPVADHLWTVRTRLLKALAPSGARHRRVLISRADAVERKLVNEEELLAALEDLEFEPVLLSRLTVAEQVRLFDAADVVLGAHGAGLTNILFSPRHCKVMELVGNSHYSPSYATIASIMGQPYGYVRCEERARQLVVDPSAVRSVLGDLDRVGAATALDGQG